MMNFKEEAALLRSERAARVEAEKAAAREVLRDEFAMAALTGYLSGALCERQKSAKEVADDCYWFANAMMAARPNSARGA